MKIGIDARCLLDKNLSGVGLYAKNVIENMIRLAPDDEFILYANTRRGLEKNLPDYSFENVNNIISKFPNRLFNLSLALLNTPSLDKSFGNPDVIFMPNLNFAKFSKVPYVITFHDLTFELFPQHFSKRGILWHKMINPKRLAKNAKKIISVSHSTKEDLVNEYNLPSEKISVVHHGFDSPDTNMAIASNLKTILFLANIEPRKNILSIIKSFINVASSIPHNLVIAGGQGWQYGKTREEAEKLINDSGLSNRVEFKGYVSFNERAVLYSKADLFLFPSLYEGFGLPILEAFSYGLPVITSNLSSLPEIAGNAAILVDPYNINEISDAITEVINNKELREKLILRGQEQVNKFNWEKCARETLSVIKSAV